MSDTRYDNRFEFNLGRGNRKTRSKPNPDDMPGSTTSSNIAVSQIAQELPMRDRKEWLQDLFRLETVDELADRCDRELVRHFGGPDDPISLEYGLAWARTRLQEGATWRKSRKIF